MIINIAANEYLKGGTKGREFISSLIFMNIDLLLVGCGGTGGCFFSKMVRFLTSIEFQGIDFRFRIIDGDRVEAKNIGRQPFLLEDVGKNKAVALASVAEELMDIKVKAYPFYLSPGKIEVLDQFDFDSVSTSDLKIIIGAVDNHACRSILHNYFMSYKKIPMLIYVDSANELSAGEIVIGVRNYTKIITPDRAHYYPEILENPGKAAYELSCEELNASAPQHLATNGIAGDLLFSYISQVIVAAEKAAYAPGGIIYFDAFQMFSRFDRYEEERHGKIKQK